MKISKKKLGALYWALRDIDVAGEIVDKDPELWSDADKLTFYRGLVESAADEMGQILRKVQP